MKRFVVPPSWPSPPRRSWVPPKTWRPDPAWPPAPEGWKFWVDGKGNPVRGPIGRYGGPSSRVAYAAVAAAVVFLGVNIWALSAIGLFGGKNDDPAAVQFVDDRSPSPKPSTHGPTTTGTATIPPRVPTTATPTQRTTTRPTQQPTERPTKTRTTERRTEAPSTPTRTTTTTRTPRPPRTTTTTPPTEAEILRQYCVQRGWPPEWCDPNHWRGTTRPPTGR